MPQKAGKWAILDTKRSAQGPENKELSESAEKGAVQNPVHDAPISPDLPADLAEVVQVWPGLPEHIRAAIRALAGLRESGQA